ncbi:hypothetical protein [Mesorhizobium sp. M4B.F.Ca.ET.017.02.2.1]|uniref:hypothetical protein n=1 Tax=Mesorhizobium sp. M4B.F.Ca.ET.017.02.2.1 TaxID=2496649 RepID=UPI000FCA7181|nr:hypothetical protein [Mesorhizobium sp. M4B.F.Ca.ET.017.02.2.1]RVD31760.1 hypothetical protein EN738_00085 [Mesorhizobium sp. M4B.F.Ca.ET.017.02.2.1]
MSAISNPFLNAEINAPNEFQEFFQRYSQSTGASSVDELDRKPFPRMVDFWFLAIGVAVKKKLKAVDLTGMATYKAAEGAAVSSPEWRIHALKLIAIGETGDPTIVTDGRAMMRIANSLAFAGMPHLVEILEEHLDDEAFGLCDALIDLLDN